MATIVVSNKGAKCLLFEKFKYRIAHTSKSGEIRWRCTNSKCGAAVFTNTSDTIVFKKCNEHNHEAVSENLLNRQQVTQVAKRKAVEDILEKPSKLIRIGENKVNSKSTFTKHDADCVRKNIYYARRKKWPALPKSIEEVQQFYLVTDADSVSATGRSNTRLELPIQGPSGQGAEPSDTFLELPSTSNRPDSVSATGRSNTRLEVPLQGPSRQGAEPSDTFLELPSTSSGPVTKRRRKNIDSYEDDSTSDSSKPIEMRIDDSGASRHLQCQSDENMSDSDSLIDIIKHEIDIPEDVPDSVTSQELETVMINDDDDDSQSTHNIEEIRMKEEPSKQNDFDDRHPIDVFCKSVALSLKSLRMDLCNEGKIRIMQLISELEQRNSLPSEGPSTSKSSNNYAEPTSTVTKYLVPKKEFD